MKLLIKTLFFIFIAKGAFSQSKVTWNTLADVQFNKQWNAKEKMFILIPQFGQKVKPLQDKSIEITGYMIPMDVETNYYVLSANPFASCFFCGGSGPESVMSVKFKGKNRRFDTDERVTLRGKLKLNTDNFEELNYILTEAEAIN